MPPAPPSSSESGVYEDVYTFPGRTVHTVILHGICIRREETASEYVAPDRMAQLQRWLDALHAPERVAAGVGRGLRLLSWLGFLLPVA